MSHILVIGGMDFSIRCLSDLAIDYTMIQKANGVTQFQQANASQLVEMDYTNSAEALALAESLHSEKSFAAVISFAEFGMETAALIAKALNLPTNCNLETIEVTRDKFAMRERLKEEHLDNLAYAKVNSVEDIRHFFNNTTGKAIIKPSQGAGSSGVFLVESLEEAERALLHAKQSNMGEIIAESYVGGTEYSIESLSKNGKHEVLAITEKLTTGAPYFVELGHSQPARLDAGVEAIIHDKVLRLLDAIKHLTGPAHTEVKVEDGNVFVIETQTRQGGDNIWHMNMLTKGVDIFKETVASLLKLDAPVREAKAKAAAVRYLTTSVEKVSRIENIDSVAQLPGVANLHINLTEGEYVKPVTSSFDRAGFVVTTGDTASHAIATAENALGAIAIS
ncbi:ATP-grasp domain-containing protein [Pseudoalteromonas sp. DL2-H2.2]|uniref:ATP-grasp domain-containing protein n=1 Tax=Pseudoalteromonas sp. DL2-H2.2 TaxID=2908889 RepID=UPI001F4784FF|nr:ATP-grasp domain-containing protein [Pseudoalteromonas sp. DL2-H2.2]MCF2907557.1 ATP-grasp domain-containing protein [Pseudoalteromonas sp. DL2-H2.2]